MFKKIISRPKISPYLIRASLNEIGIAIGTVRLRNYAVFQYDNYFGEDRPSFLANPFLGEVLALLGVGKNILRNVLGVIPRSNDL